MILFRVLKKLHVQGVEERGLRRTFLACSYGEHKLSHKKLDIFSEVKEGRK